MCDLYFQRPVSTVIQVPLKMIHNSIYLAGATGQSLQEARSTVWRLGKQWGGDSTDVHNQLFITCDGLPDSLTTHVKRGRAQNRCTEPVISHHG